MKSRQDQSKFSRLTRRTSDLARLAKRAVRKSDFFGKRPVAGAPGQKSNSRPRPALGDITCLAAPFFSLLYSTVCLYSTVVGHQRDGILTAGRETTAQFLESGFGPSIRTLVQGGGCRGPLELSARPILLSIRHSPSLTHSHSHTYSLTHSLTPSFTTPVLLQIAEIAATLLTLARSSTRPFFPAFIRLLRIVTVTVSRFNAQHRDLS